MTAQIIDFDLAVQRLKGVTYAMAFRNHRNLRMTHMIVNGVYVAKAQKGGPLVAA
jgi:hypothetical protein